MRAANMVTRSVRFAIRSLLVPGLIAASALGVTSGGRGTASVWPDATTIAKALSAHHELPKGTRLTLGDPAEPTTVTYDQGRILITPPRGETFGTVLARGFAEMGRVAGDARAGAAHASTRATSTAR